MIKVVLHRVLVERVKPEDTEAVKTKKALESAGFVVPASVEEDMEKQISREEASMDTGTVVDVGETAFTDYGINPPIKPGDFISFVKFGGKDVEDPATGKKYVIINDEDVICILTKEGA